MTFVYHSDATTGTDAGFAASFCLVLVLCLLNHSCAETHTFEGTLEANIDVDSRFDPRQWRTDFPRLTLKTSPDENRDLMLEINHFGVNEGRSIGWLRLVDRDRDKITDRVIDRAVITEIVSGDQRVRPSDLRVGQQIRISYAKASIPEKTAAKLEIVDYQRPPKVLRISISLDVKDLTPEETSALEEDLVTSLSWRLPKDISLAKAGEIAEGSNVVGELSVNYFRFTDKDDSVRRTDFLPVYLKHDVIRLETKFADPNSKCNWSQLRLIGSERVKEGENRTLLIVNDMALTKVPFFQF